MTKRPVVRIVIQVALALLIVAGVVVVGFMVAADVKHESAQSRWRDECGHVVARANPAADAAACRAVRFTYDLRFPGGGDVPSFGKEWEVNAYVDSIKDGITSIVEAVEAPPASGGAHACTPAPLYVLRARAAVLAGARRALNHGDAAACERLLRTHARLAEAWADEFDPGHEYVHLLLVAELSDIVIQCAACTASMPDDVLPTATRLRERVHASACRSAQDIARLAGQSSSQHLSQGLKMPWIAKAPDAMGGAPGKLVLSVLVGAALDAARDVRLAEGRVAPRATPPRLAGRDYYFYDFAGLPSEVSNAELHLERATWFASQRASAASP